MARDENNKGGIIFGPILVVGAVLCLWHNEGRFDYYKAARLATPVDSVEDAGTKETIAFTGALGEVVLPGRYVTRFEGYYDVKGNSEIYCWDRSEDEDGDVSWSLRWSNSVESNSRNSGVVKRLKDVRLQSDRYEVGALEVDGHNLAFPDRSVGIDPSNLELTEEGKRYKFSIDGRYFYLRMGAGGGAELGDERIAYSGTPTEGTATYFGAVEGSSAVGRQFEQSEGTITKLVDQLIDDQGRLHHLANGERRQALRAVKSDITRKKWLVRGIGTAAAILGFLFFLSRILYLLVSIPLLGSLVQMGLFVVSIVLGLGLSLLTILASLLVHRPIVALLPLGLAALVVVLLILQRRETRAGARKILASAAAGTTPSPGAPLASGLAPGGGPAPPATPHQQAEPIAPVDAGEVVRRRFRNLVRVALADSKLDPAENEFLVNWGQSHGLSDEDLHQEFDASKARPEAELEAGSRQDLQFLVSLALADGSLTPKEMNRLFEFGRLLGVDRGEISTMLSSVRKGVILVPGEGTL